MKRNSYRYLEPILLGVSANLIINYIFNPSEPDWIVKEFVIAVILCIPLTELSHFTDKKLENKIPWIDYPTKRFITHFTILLVSVMLVVNVIGGLYWKYIDIYYFTFNEMALMNLVVLVLVIVLSFIKWTRHFLLNWKLSHMKLTDVTVQNQDLTKEINKERTKVRLKKGQYNVEVDTVDLLIAKYKSGVVVVRTKEESYLFEGTLSELDELLPQHLFHRLNREVIANRQIIKSYKAGTYGKVEVVIKSEDIILEVTVSRPKASSFRNWIDSTSA